MALNDDESVSQRRSRTSRRFLLPLAAVAIAVLVATASYEAYESGYGVGRGGLNCAYSRGYWDGA